MKLEEFANAINSSVIIEEEEKDYYTCRMEYCELVSGHWSEPVVGEGETSEAARQDYIGLIQGETLVTDKSEDADGYHEVPKLT